LNRQHISSGSRFESEIGYSRAVVAGGWVFVSGTTGFDYATMAISGDVREQAAQCFKNIAATMVSAGLLDPRMKIEIEVTALRPQA
jgi:enamine deaminase RidA (YjgF/YER057c/UK114 family)